MSDKRKPLHHAWYFNLVAEISFAFYHLSQRQAGTDRGACWESDSSNLKLGNLQGSMVCPSSDVFHLESILFRSVMS